MNAEHHNPNGVATEKESKPMPPHQEEHHRKMTFQDELRTLLSKHQVEWDERYVWD
jgi:hypothetical protein